MKEWCIKRYQRNMESDFLFEMWFVPTNILLVVGAFGCGTLYVLEGFTPEFWRCVQVFGFLLILVQPPIVVHKLGAYFYKQDRGI